MKAQFFLSPHRMAKLRNLHGIAVCCFNDLIWFGYLEL